MKKLKIKVFSIIFSILSVFIILMLLITNIRNYNLYKSRVEEILNGPIFIKKIQKDVDNIDVRNIFLDSTVYTIIINNNTMKIINNTTSDTIDEEKLLEVATDIINNNTKKYYIGNLYTNKFSYFYNNDTLVIVDNTKTNKELKVILINTLIIFLSVEIIVYFVCYFLTKWVTEPVEKSFEKQKKFIEDASHELKTPLSVILTSTDAYYSNKDEKWIKNIRNESERMSKLVKDLLDLASLENTKEVVMSNENISNIVESSVLTFESLFYEKKVKLEYDITDNIYLKCNQDEIKQLVGILLDNAIKYSDANGKVKVNLKSDNKQIIFEVKNKGLEISKQDEEKIFERFYKIDTSRNRNNNNYGLGLSIAKKIVLNHGGKISASSKNGYTTFKVIFYKKNK
jgi:two-component system, OmpR family, sensor histidine kinase CiaH